MSLPVDAEVRAVPNFLACLRAARVFMVEQDAATAPARFERLQAVLVQARALLAFTPASGRPARFVEARSHWGRFQAQTALQLARALELPELRELVLARHVVLYAHSDRRAVLLSLRHERQLAYRLAAPAD